MFGFFGSAVKLPENRNITENCDIPEHYWPEYNKVVDSEETCKYSRMFPQFSGL